MRRRGDPKILVHDLVGWNRHDLTESIGRIVCPTLLIKGEDDPAIPEEMVERTAQAIRGSELKSLPGVGHFPMVEFDGFADLVTDFLNRHGL
jgi:pimeloyl-ACP methyl ester carboxylesterase